MSPATTKPTEGGEREIRGEGGEETERESAMSPQNWEIGEERLLSAGEQEGPQCTTQGGSDGSEPSAASRN